MRTTGSTASSNEALPPPQLAIDAVLEGIRSEVMRAEAKHAPIHSAHEGYAVILEELDELWDEVKKKPALRDGLSMETEAIQTAAMAVRFVLNVLWHVPAVHAMRDIPSPVAAVDPVGELAQRDPSTRENASS